MTPTTSRLHRASRLCSTWPRESGLASGTPPSRSRGISATSGLSRRPAEGRSPYAVLGWVVVRSGAVRPVGETRSEWEGESAPERWKKTGFRLEEP